MFCCFFIFLDPPPSSLLAALPSFLFLCHIPSFPKTCNKNPTNPKHTCSLPFLFRVCFSNPFLDSLQLLYRPIYSVLAAVAAGASPTFFAFFFFPPAAGGGVAGLGSFNCRLNVSWTLLETPSLNCFVVCL